MAFFKNTRWRRFCLATAFVGIAVGGFWLYLVFTRTPINAVNFNKLDTGMTLVEVEAILGGAASRKNHVEELVTRGPDGIKAVDKDDGFHPIPGMWDEYAARWLPPGSDKFGDFARETFEVARADAKTDKIVEVHIWDSSEARIVASIDERSRVAAARFQRRNSWRWKLEQWLPWLQ